MSENVLKSFSDGKLWHDTREYKVKGVFVLLAAGEDDLSKWMSCYVPDILT